jgi:predicted MFS family arabinose efflux permease
LKPTSRSTLVLVVLALTNLVSYAARNGLFAVYPTLKAKFAIDDGQIGLLTTVFMLPHAAATLPFGWAGDRFDRRRVIVVGISIASVAGALGALAVDWYSLAASRALVGLGTAAVVPVANSILGQIFDGPQKASRMSIFNLGLFLGGVVGFFAGSAFGFPAVVIILAVPGLLLAATLGGLPIPDRPIPPRARLRDFIRHLIADARELLPIRTLRWVLLSATAMAFAAGGFNAWLNEFLIRPVAQGGKGMHKEDATQLLVLALCGGLAGILVGGRVADRLRRRSDAGRLWTIVIGMGCTIPCAATAILLPAGAGLVAAGIATMFFISWYHAPIAASVDDLAPAARSVAAQGLVIFTMHMIGTAPSSYIVGVISQQTSLATAMWVPTGGLVVAALCMVSATASFARDRARARPGGAAEASL